MDDESKYAATDDAPRRHRRGQPHHRHHHRHNEEDKREGRRKHRHKHRSKKASEHPQREDTEAQTAANDATENLQANTAAKAGPPQAVSHHAEELESPDNDATSSGIDRSMGADANDAANSQYSAASKNTSIAKLLLEAPQDEGDSPRTPAQITAAYDDSIAKSSSNHFSQSHEPSLQWNANQPKVHPANAADRGRSTSKPRLWTLFSQHRPSPATTQSARRDVSSDADEGHVGINIGPPPSTDVPVLSARLVGEEPEAPVYDAVVAVASIDAPSEISPPFWKKHQKCILGGLVVIVLGLIAVVVAVVTSSDKGSNSNNESTQQSIQDETTLLYYADRKNDRCDDDPSGRPSPELRQRLYDSLTECCGVEFFHLEDKECVKNSLLVDTPATTTSTSLPSVQAYTTANATPNLLATTKPDPMPDSTTCSEDLAGKLQNILMAEDDNYGSDNPLNCTCISTTALGESADNIVSCAILLDEACEYDFCDNGWNCTKSSEKAVQVCFVHMYEDQYMLDASTNLIHVATVSTRYITKGVSNVKSWTTVIDRRAEPISCGGYFVDDQACVSCAFCDVSDTITTVADCSNVKENADATCEDDDGFFEALFVLDSAATNDPPSTTTAQAPYSTALVWKQQGQAITGDNALDESGMAVALSAEGNILAIGTPGPDDEETNDRTGYVKVWARQGDGGWLQLGQTIEGVVVGDRFGYSVDLSADGKTLAVGAPGFWQKFDRPGYTMVYALFDSIDSEARWEQIGGKTIYGEENSDQSGVSVAVSSDGKTLAIGASGHDGIGVASGHVRIFQVSEGGNGQLGQTIDGEAALDNSGMSIDISADGKTVAIGAAANDGNGEDSGHVRIYQLTEGDEPSWKKVGDDIDGISAGDQSGGKVSLSADGKTVAIGAVFNAEKGEGAGHVRVFQLLQGDGAAFEWRKLGPDLYGDGAGDSFGNAVSLSGDGKILAVGASGNWANSGNVKVFAATGDGAATKWTQLGQKIIGEELGDHSGWSVSISDDGGTVAIGSVWNDDSGDKAGHVRVFSVEQFD